MAPPPPPPSPSKALQGDSSVEGSVFISKDSNTSSQFSIKTLDMVLFSRLAPRTATTKQHARTTSYTRHLHTHASQKLQCTARWLVPY